MQNRSLTGMFIRVTAIIVMFMLPTQVFASLAQQDIEADIENLLNIRHAFDQMKTYMHERDDLFMQQRVNDKRLTSREQRNEIWAFWQGFLDRIIMLDMLGSKYGGLYGAGPTQPFEIYINSSNIKLF